MNAILSYPLRHRCVTAICPATELFGIDPAKLVGEIRRTYNNVGQFRMRQTKSHVL